MHRPVQHNTVQYSTMNHGTRDDSYLTQHSDPNTNLTLQTSPTLTLASPAFDMILSSYLSSCITGTLQVRIPMPHNTASAKLTATKGRAKYEPGVGALVWRIGAITGDEEVGGSETNPCSCCHLLPLPLPLLILLPCYYYYLLLPTGQLERGSGLVDCDKRKALGQGAHHHGLPDPHVSCQRSAGTEMNIAYYLSRQ